MGVTDWIGDSPHAQVRAIDEPEELIVQRSSLKVVVGADVSEATLDVAVSVPCKIKRVANTAAGVAKLVAVLKDIGAELIVLEATGGYERVLVDALHQAGLPVHVANPRRVRAFAIAAGILSKTDKIDAKTLILYGEAIDVEPTPAPDPSAREIAELQKRHRQLVENNVSEKNRLKTAPHHLQDGIKRHIAWLDQEIAQIEQRIKLMIKGDTKLSAKAKLVMSVPGVGVATSAALIGHFPELGQISNKQAAALAGLAPYADDSGKKTGKRSIRYGRSHVRCALYMATLCAIRIAGPFRFSYQRLLGLGKPKKVAIVACMRKLITTLNSLMRTGQTWSPTAAEALPA